MAVDLSFFPSQQPIITTSNLMDSNQQNVYMYNPCIDSGASLTGMMPENLIPFPQANFCDSARMFIKSYGGGVTNNLSNVTRKRSRDSTVQINNFLGEEFSLQMQQQQFEIESIIAQHTKKIRVEIENKQKQQERLLLSAIGESVMKKLNEKDNQIQRIGKMNLLLQEKVKNLLVENQLWKNMAQANEATAITLRSNLEQVLALVSKEKCNGGQATVVADEAESCCGSTCPGVEEKMGAAAEVGGNGGGRMCRKCGNKESSVLLLPCRHLCLCTVCGSSLIHSCPVCNSSTNASVHVNIS